MPVFDKLQRASFFGIEFPVQSVKIRGRLRRHEHEYLRVPGAVNEKLGRGLYTIEMEAVFDANIKGYGPLWPNSLGQLREVYEQELTGPIVVPTIGTIPGFITEWDQTAEMGKRRSGETLRIPFLEDQTELFLTEALLDVERKAAQSAAEKFQLTRADFEVGEADRNLFDKIQDGANQVLALRDQGELYGGLAAAKVAGVTNLLNEADQTAESLKNPQNHELFSAMAELWDAMIDFGRNLAESPRGARQYRVPRLMSVSDIATAIYGDTGRASELMLNNDLEDPFAVPAGEVLIYFEG